MNNDCFAARKAYCAVLTDRDCEDCAFFKTPEQFRLDRETAMRRIMTLAPGERQRIIEMYHKGRTIRKVLDFEGALG